jgi:hypothetical protein
LTVTVTVTVMAKLANMMSEREMELGFGLERVDYSTQTYLENMMSPFRMAFDDYHSDVTLQYSQDPQDELLAEQDLREFDPEVESASVGDEEGRTTFFELLPRNLTDASYARVVFQFVEANTDSWDDDSEASFDPEIPHDLHADEVLHVILQG